MTMHNLLVELLVEELPPKALKKLGLAFATVLADSLKTQGLAAANAVVADFASPRQLAQRYGATSPHSVFFLCGVLSMHLTLVFLVRLEKKKKKKLSALSFLNGGGV